MIVYVVVRDYGQDGDHYYGVYATREEAQRELDIIQSPFLKILEEEIDTLD